MRVVVRKEGVVVSTLDSNKEVVFLGRSKSNDVVLNDADVSRRHGKFVLQGDLLIYEDLKSANGTRLRGEKIRRVEVREGDLFQFGPFEIVATKDEAGEPAMTSLLPEEGTTFAEATTDVTPDEHTLPPDTHAPKEPTGDFLDAIAVRPQAKSGGTDALRVLRNFLDETSLPDPPSSEPAEDEKTPSARLVRLDGEKAGEEIPIDREELSIGSAPAADVLVPYEEVSHAHAVIQKGKGSYVLRDQQESTGTFVDGVPVRERALENHDIVSVGPERFEFVSGAARSRAARPRVVERAKSARASRTTPSLLHWKALALVGFVAGAIIVFVVPRPKTNPAPVVSTPTPVVNADPEALRSIRQNLGRAQELIQKKKYDEAEVRVRHVLDKLSPNHPEAIGLLEEIDSAQAEERRQREKRKRTQAERSRKIRRILDEGNRLRDKGDFAGAKRAFEEATFVDASNDEVREAMEDLRVQIEEARLEAENRRRSDAELQKLYVEGVTRFESGDFGNAERLLSQVAARKRHKYQASAQRLVDEIHRAFDKKIEKQVSEAEALAESGELTRAQKALSAILRQFPKQARAKKLLADVSERLDSKARQLYTEGIALQELAEDPVAAKERFEEVLKLVPRENDYYRKASQKLKELPSKVRE